MKMNNFMKGGDCFLKVHKVIMLDITTSRDYKPSLNQTLWMQSKASVYNSIIIINDNNFKQFCKFYFDKAEFETVLYSISPSLHDRKRTYIAFPFSPFFPQKKRKHFCRSRLKDAILETHLKLKDDQNQE